MSTLWKNHWPARILAIGLLLLVSLFVLTGSAQAAPQDVKPLPLCQDGQTPPGCFTPDAVNCIQKSCFLCDQVSCSPTALEPDVPDGGQTIAKYVNLPGSANNV